MAEEAFKGPGRKMLKDFLGVLGLGDQGEDHIPLRFAFGHERHGGDRGLSPFRIVIPRGQRREIGELGRVFARRSRAG